MRQHLTLEPTQVGTQVEPGRVGERAARPLDRAQAVSLATGPVEGEREQAVQALVERVLVDGPLEGHQRAGVVAEIEAGLGRGFGALGRAGSTGGRRRR